MVLSRLESRVIILAFAIELKTEASLFQLIDLRTTLIPGSGRMSRDEVQDG